jgi:hypothetical protein
MRWAHGGERHERLLFSLVLVCLRARGLLVVFFFPSFDMRYEVVEVVLRFQFQAHFLIFRVWVKIRERSQTRKTRALTRPGRANVVSTKRRSKSRRSKNDMRGRRKLLTDDDKEENGLLAFVLSSASFLSSSSSPGGFPRGATSWKAIRREAKERTGARSTCAICREEFGLEAMDRAQVLTSCAHCFHEQCLRSFESFLDGRRCPCCRTSRYRKIRIHDARKEVVVNAALKIQKAWRGFVVRNKLGPTNAIARKSWMASKLRALRKRVERSAEERRTTRRHLAEDERADSSLSSSSSSDEDEDDDDTTTTDWNAIIVKSLSLENDECSICALRFAAPTTATTATTTTTDDDDDARKKVAYLCCSHRFHKSCLRTFEKHLKSIGRVPFCPCCRRQNYSRKCL